MRYVWWINCFLLIAVNSWANNGPEGKKKSDTTTVLNFEASIRDDQDLSDFERHCRIYSLPYGVDFCWNAYRQANPHNVWNGRFNHLKLYMGPQENFNETRFKEGGILLLDLKLFLQVKAVALFKINDIDDEKHFIELIYGKTGKSSGLQRIKFDGDDQHTTITHTSFYKSKSKFRDKVLYPPFHEK